VNRILNSKVWQAEEDGGELSDFIQRCHGGTTGRSFKKPKKDEIQKGSFLKKKKRGTAHLQRGFLGQHGDCWWTRLLEKKYNMRAHGMNPLPKEKIQYQSSIDREKQNKDSY